MIKILKDGVISGLGILLMAGCATQKAYTFVELIPYKQFTEAGIYVTESDDVSFAYDPLASVEAVSVGGITKEKDKRTKKTDDLYVNTDVQVAESAKKRYVKVYKEANFDDAAKSLILQLKDIGATGLLCMKCSYIANDGAGNSRYIIRGMAIHR